MIEDKRQWDHIEDILLDEIVILSKTIEHCLFVAKQAIPWHVVVYNIRLWYFFFLQVSMA